MITISILGLDQFVVGRYSRESTANIANLYEVDASKIIFYAPNSMIFHQGVEQTSWSTLVIVRAPLKVKVLEKFVADYIMKTLTTYTINVEVEFEYYEQDSHYEKINPEYPRYIAADKADPEEYVEPEDEEFNEENKCECGEHHDHDHECKCGHHHDEEELDINDPDQIYLGNAFEGFEEKLEEASKNKKN